MNGFVWSALLCLGLAGACLALAGILDAGWLRVVAVAFLALLLLIKALRTGSGDGRAFLALVAAITATVALAYTVERFAA